MKWPLIDMEEMIEKGVVKLGRGNVISKIDISTSPGTYPIYSSARLNDGKFGEYGKYMFDQELITWSVDGGGKFFYRPKHKFSVTNVAGTLEILKPDILFYKYIYYVLSDKHSRLVFDWSKKAHPSVIRRLYKEIPLPPLEDQIRIAALLSRVESLIAIRKNNLQLLDDFLKSTFFELFGDPKINERNYPVRVLSEFYIDPKNGTKCGPFGSALKKHEYVDKGIPVWNMDNISIDGRFVPDVNLWITNTKYSSLVAYTTINGDVIISRAGTVGKMCVVETTFKKSIISTNLIRVRFNKDLLPIYFVHLMTYFKGRIGNLKTGPDGAFTHMNTGILDKLRFPYPPVVLQEKYASIIVKINSLRNIYQDNLKELENLYGSLSKKVFKGELDLSQIPISKVNELDTNLMESGEEKAESVRKELSDIVEYPMSDSDARKTLLKEFFDDFIKNANEKEFRVDDFFQSISIKVTDYMDEESEHLNDKDYDVIKDRLFDLIKEGKIEQTFVENEEKITESEIRLKVKG